MSLSDTAIRKAKPADKPIKLTEGKGLFLLLNPNGSRWWRFNYRRPITGKRNTLSFGTYPDTGLADARVKRDEARKLLAAGVDPGEHRKANALAGQERAANSFEVVAREWFAKQELNWVTGHSEKVLRRLENDVFPWLGKCPVSDVTSKELLATVNRIVARGAVDTAHRALQNSGQIFRYAIVTGRADRNSATDLRGALPSPKEAHLAAITDPDEVAGLLRAMDAYSGSIVTKAALCLAPLVFVRPGELRHAEWAEINLDKAKWNIPASKMKMAQPHLVPLSEQAAAILSELHPPTGRSPYVFPGARSPKRPMSDNAILAALRTMGFARDEMTGHGFRAMARTILDEVLHFRLPPPHPALQHGAPEGETGAAHIPACPFRR